MTTTMAEPEWDVATRNLVLGLADVDLCPACGRPSYICQDPARQFDWRAEDPVRCHAKTALLERQAAVSEETNPHIDALLWRVVLSERREKTR